MVWQHRKTNEPGGRQATCIPAETVCEGQPVDAVEKPPSCRICSAKNGVEFSTPF